MISGSARQNPVPALIVHGGAGALSPPAERKERQRGLLAAVRKGAGILRNGGSALDAMIAAVSALEDNPWFNAGYGSVLNIEGKVEMDAGVMIATPDPPPLAASRRSRSTKPKWQVKAGGVAMVNRVRNPVMLARAVMERTPHLLMAGAGAERLARLAGLPRCAPDDLVSDRARTRWLERQAQARAANIHPPANLQAHGTVGAAAVDRNGQVAAGTSTGGVGGKLTGRIGDSAIIGAGVFAGRLGAASATGEGEAIMKVAVCREAVVRLARSDPAAAAGRAISLLEQSAAGVAGIILVNARGKLGYALNAPAMEIATFEPAGIRHLTLTGQPASARL